MTDSIIPNPKDGISIVIPAFNEANRIGTTVQRIEEYGDAHFEDFEIIVVDDGSSDGTLDIARTALRNPQRLVAVKNPGNRGKGYSTKNGCQYARFPYVLMSDADLSTPIEEIEKLVPFAAPTAVVIASRGMAGSDLEVRQPLYRELMGRIFNLFVRVFVIAGISDSQCGFKLFGRVIVKKIMPMLETDGFAFDVEVLARADRMGCTIIEVPVRWRNDERTRVSAISDSARMFMDILSVKWKIRKMPKVKRHADA